jgi:hypothetical protein
MVSMHDRTRAETCGWSGVNNIFSKDTSGTHSVKPRPTYYVIPVHRASTSREHRFELATSFEYKVEARAPEKELWSWELGAGSWELFIFRHDQLRRPLRSRETAWRALKGVGSGIRIIGLGWYAPTLLLSSSGDYHCGVANRSSLWTCLHTIIYSGFLPLLPPPIPTARVRIPCPLLKPCNQPLHPHPPCLPKSGLHTTPSQSDHLPPLQPKLPRSNQVLVGQRTLKNPHVIRAQRDRTRRVCPPFAEMVPSEPVLRHAGQDVAG